MTVGGEPVLVAPPVTITPARPLVPGLRAS